MNTLRRFYLDNLLSNTSFFGKVLDIGGKKEKKRGTFRPPLSEVESWEYVNIDASTLPDYQCSAEKIPVLSDSFDVVLMTEVLEHLEAPERVLAECHRVLKERGKLIMTIPFLYPVHGDPCDFQRWTPYKINHELQKAGFLPKKINEMGGVYSVIYDLLYIHFVFGSRFGNQTYLKRIILRFFLLIMKKIVSCMEYSKINNVPQNITTGYYVYAEKNVTSFSEILL